MRKLLIIAAAFLSASTFAQDPAQGANPQATIHTNHGDIRIELFAKEAPISTENFLQYARDGYYDGTIFHRIISHFMIQGGGFTADREQKQTRDPIVNEADNGLSNQRGTLAMARTNDVNSATAQFFINVELNAGLDHTGKDSSREWGYAVFGKVIEGMDVVDDIRFVETGPNDWPLETVLIESVELH